MERTISPSNVRQMRLFTREFSPASAAPHPSATAAPTLATRDLPDLNGFPTAGEKALHLLQAVPAIQITTAALQRIPTRPRDGFGIRPLPI